MKAKALSPADLARITQRHERDKANRTRYGGKPASRPESDRADLLAHVAHLQQQLDQAQPRGEQTH